MFKHTFYRDISVYDNEKPGPSLLFLHGLGANAAFGEFLTQVFPKHRLLIPEFPGHGESKALQGDIDIYNLALELRNLTDHFNIHIPLICGHSLGGQLALIFDLVHPGYAKELHLIAPAGLEKFNDYQKNIIESGLSMGGMFQQFFIPTIQPLIIKSSLKIPDSKILNEYSKSMIERPVQELLGQIKTETYVYFGTNDPLIPNRIFTMEQTIAFAHKILDPFPNYHLIPVPGAGHWPMLENRPELIRLMQETQTGKKKFNCI